jgi:hypothetical protein
MFVSAITPAVAGQDPILRPLDWAELTARFAAVRDLRALVGRPAHAMASFAGRAGTGLSRDRADEPHVNLAALGGVKTLAAITAATVEEVAESDQGTR